MYKTALEAFIILNIVDGERCSKIIQYGQKAPHTRADIASLEDNSPARAAQHTKKEGREAEFN